MAKKIRRYIALSAIIGAIIMAIISTAQGMLVESSLDLHAYILQLCFGGLTGGIVGWLNFRKLSNDHGDKPDTLTGDREITEKNHPQESEKHFRTMFEQNHVVILLVDPESGLIKDANQAAANFYGWPVQKLCAMNISQLNKLSPDEVRMELTSARQSLKRHFNFRHTLADGSIRDVEVFSGPIHVAGKDILYSCIFDVTKRKETENALRLSTSNLRATLNTTVDGILAVDAEGKILFYNSQFLKMWDLTKSLLEKPENQILLHHLAEKLDHKEDSPEEIELLYSSAENRVNRIPLKNGRTLECSSSSMFVEEDVSKGRVWSFRDITEQIKTEEDILKREALMAGVFRAAPVGIGVLVDRVIIKTNDKLCEMAGYTREELIGQSARLLYSSDEEFARVGRKKYAMIQEQGTGSLETKWLCKDGRIIEVFLSSTPLDPDDLLAGVIFTVLDITERVYAQKKTETEAFRRRLLMDAASDGIAIMNGDHAVVEANASFAKMLGYTLKEIIGLHTWEWEANYSEEQIRGGMPDVAKIQTTFETVHKRKDGTTYDAEVSASGAMIGNQPLVITITRDISERKAMELSMFHSMEAAEKANRSKSEFLANMSHEIRTPLNGIVGMLELIRLSAENEEQREYSDTAIASSKRLTRLLSDILDLSSVEAGKLSINSEPFVPEETIYEAYNLFTLMAEQTGLDFKYHVDSSLKERVKGDAGRIEQLLVNLLGNSFKFTTRGSITLEAYPLPHQNPNYKRIMLSVSDTGIGIPDDKIETLYQPFTQVHSGYTRPYQGAGLGLAICKRLVTLMEGSMTIKSSFGEGTTVFLCLPFELAEPEITSEQDLKPKLAILSTLRVLLVEDEKTNRIVAQRLLEHVGTTVVSVEHGMMALEELRKNTFDLILMDVQMPIMDGIETTTAIRAGKAGEHCKDIPIIALTGHAMAGDRNLFLSTGMNDYVSKPIEWSELENKILDLVSNTTD